MRSEYATLFMVGMILAFASASADAASLDDFVDFSGVLPGRMYVPPEAADPANPRPLVLFLHGGLSAGTDNQRHVCCPPPVCCPQPEPEIDALVTVAKERGAFLYAPQSPHAWNTGGWHSSGDVMTMIDQAIAQENIDPNRLYVTGLSMGGGGTWDMLNHVDDRFAAALPIATDIIRPDLDAGNFLDTPIWAFHARNDGIATVSGVRRIINNIQAELNEPPLTFPRGRDDTVFEYKSETIPLKYTEWPHGAGWQNHIIHPIIWSDTEVMDWMFSQKRSRDLGDFNGDGRLTASDIDLLSNAIRTFPGDPGFDLNGDGVVDLLDHDHWVTDPSYAGKPIGDVDLDGKVDFPDFLLLSASFGQDGGWAQGDLNADGQVSFPDFLRLSANFGAAANASTAAVPEPAGLYLAMFGLLGIIGYRRRR